MAEYIEREATCRDCFYYDVCDYHITEMTTMTVNECPHKFVNKADVVEVRHGKWIKPTPCSQEYCNQCGLTPKMVFGMLPNYCPNCGAKMDGKEGAG